MKPVKRKNVLSLFVCALFVSIAWARSSERPPIEKQPSTWESIGKARQAQRDSQSAEYSEVSELLDKFAENHHQNELNSFIIKTEMLIDRDNRLTGRTEAEKQMVRRYTGKHKERRHDEYRYDGQRTYYHRELWSADVSDAKYEPVGNSNYMSFLFDGRDRIRYGGDRSVARTGFVVVYLNATLVKDEVFPVSIQRHSLGQYSIRDRGSEQLNSIIEKADSAVVRDKRELVRGSKCYVIDVVEGGTRCRFWLDPEHGYNTAKVICHQDGGGGVRLLIPAKSFVTRGSAICGFLWKRMAQDVKDLERVITKMLR